MNFKLYTIYALLFTASLSAQKHLKKNLYNCLLKKTDSIVSIKKIEKKPLFIVNGLLIDTEKKLGFLKEFKCNDLKSFEVISSKKAKKQFSGDKARKGIILLILNKKANRKFKKLLNKLP